MRAPMLTYQCVVDESMTIPDPAAMYVGACLLDANPSNRTWKRTGTRIVTGTATGRRCHWH